MTCSSVQMEICSSSEWKTKNVPRMVTSARVIQYCILILVFSGNLAYLLLWRVRRDHLDIYLHLLLSFFSSWFLSFFLLFRPYISFKADIFVRTYHSILFRLYKYSFFRVLGTLHTIRTKVTSKYSTSDINTPTHTHTHTHPVGNCLTYLKKIFEEFWGREGVMRTAN